MAVVRLMLSFQKGLPNSLGPTLNSSEEYETYSEAILYHRIVSPSFIFILCYHHRVIGIAFQIYTFRLNTPRSLWYSVP